MTSNDVMLDSGLLEGSRKTHKLSTFPKRITALVAGGCGLFLATSGAMTFTRPWMRKAVSSSPIVLPSVDSCHQLDGQTFKIWVSGDDNGDLNKWLSFNDDGHWLIARYNEKNDAFPVLFQAAPECNAYYLRTGNAYYDDRWISFTTCGTWLRAVYSLASAMPMKFIQDGEDGFYKLQNVYPGSGDFHQQYVSFTKTGREYRCGNFHELYSLRADYGESSAMKVMLHDASLIITTTATTTVATTTVATTTVAPSATCFPLHGSTFKMWVSGFGLGKWLSFNNDGHWLIADYDSKGSAVPVYFQAASWASLCDTYYLQNKYENDNDLWIGLTSCGTWLRAASSFLDAMPTAFIDNGDGTYTLAHDDEGPTIREGVTYSQTQTPFVSFTGSETYDCGDDHELRSLRADYGRGSAMKVTLHDAGPLSVVPCFETTGCFPPSNSYEATPSADSCHPLAGSTSKIWVSGFGLGKWLSFNNDGHWLIADYAGKSSAFPVYFQAASECDTYYLQNKYNDDDQWISFTSCGTWLRATYSLASAMPIKFTDSGDGTYSLQNKYHGSNQQFVSFTSGENYDCGDYHEKQSLRANYGEGSAMKVTLHDAGPLSVVPCFETTACFPPSNSSSLA